MTPEDKLKKLTGTDCGMRVPEGYFPDLMKRISDTLPEHPMLNRQDDEPSRYSWWVKARPIVYMAAMFAGIWLMMKVFTTIQTTPQVSVDNPPTLVSQALDNPDNLKLVMGTATTPENEIADEMMEEYDGDFDRFVEDFNDSESETDNNNP